LVCQHDTARLSSDARDYLSSLLGKNGGNAATSTSSYHGDDNEDDDDLNIMMMMMMMMMLTTTDTMMTMTAVFLKGPAKSVQSRRILQMTIMG